MTGRSSNSSIIQSLGKAFSVVSGEFLLGVKGLLVGSF